MTRFLTDIRKRAGSVRAFSDPGRRILPGFLITTAAALIAMLATNFVGGPAPLHISMLVPVITVLSLLFLNRSGGGSFP